MARRSLRRLVRLSEHLALVAELEAGPLAPERAPFDVCALAKRALEGAVAIDGRRDVVVTSDFPPDPLVITADARLLLVALREIVGNALKLAASRVAVSVKRDDGRIVIRIDDDGPGFSDDAKANLGRRFVRRRSSHGLGLSLSMAIEILAEHGGTLTLEPSLVPPSRHRVAGAAVVVTLLAS
jgi:signal transduction histidine kinase